MQTSGGRGNLRAPQPAMHLKPPLYLIGLLFAAWVCIAWADSWDALRAAAGKVTSIQADFVQQKHLPILTKPLVSKGILYFQSPGSLRWEYQSPIHSVLLLYEGRVKRFIQDTQTQRFREESGAALDAMQIVFGEITQWLAGRFDENPMFEARLEPGPKIVLTPKQKAFGQVLQRIELHLDPQPGVIQKVLIFESDEAYTELIFIKTTLNQVIDAAVFKNQP